MREQKRAIARALAVINTLNLAVLVLVAALALVAVWLGRRAQETAEKLRGASVTQARASRFGGEIGWKRTALQTIGAASQVRPTLALRNEAIAALASLDLDPAGPWNPNRLEDYSLGFSPDLGKAALGGLDGVVRVVELGSGRELLRFSMAALPDQVDFDSSGQVLAARGSDGEVRAWELESGREVLRTRVAHDNSTSKNLKWVQSRILVTAAGGTIEILEPATGGRSVWKLAAQPETLAVDGSGNATAYSTGSEIHILDSEGQLRRRLACRSHVSSLALAESGAVAAGATDNHVYLWREGHDQPEILEGHKGTVFRVEFDQGGRLLASCAFGGTTRIWEVQSGLPLLATESLFALRFSADGTRVGCSRTKAGFGVYRLSSSEVIRTLRLPQEAENGVFAERADRSQAFVLRSSGVQLVDLDRGMVRQIVTARRARGAVFLPGGDRLLTSSLDGLQVWPFSVSNSSVRPLETIPVKQGLAYEMIHPSADGKRLLARIGFRGAVLLNLETRQTEAVFNVPNIGNGEIGPDGRWVAIGTFHGEGARVFTSGGQLATNIGGRDASVRFSPDGRWLAAVSSEACEIFATGSWIRRHRIGMESASGLNGASAFSSDSSLLAFTKQRRIVKLVDPESGVELAQLLAPNVREIESLAFAAGNDQLLAGTSDGMLQVWDLSRLGNELRPLKLDWREPAPAPKKETLENWVVLVSGGTLVLAMAYSLLAWQRHRQFVAGYRRAEEMVERQHKELAAAQAELFQSQKMRALGTLAAGIAHDFNNLLSIIRMSNKLTAEEARGNPEIEENSRLIERAVAQGKEVVRSMLGYTRVSGAPGEYAPGEVLEEMLHLMRPQFLSGIKVAMDLEPDLPMAIGVRNRLEQMLLNLLVNASEAMNGKGELRVSARAALLPQGSFVLRPRPAENYVELALADSGPGIPAAARSRIFEPFFTTKSVGAARGTGLGLSMVYAIAQEEGIGISVEEATGHGTAFRLFLPARGAVERNVTAPQVRDTVAA